MSGAILLRHQLRLVHAMADRNLEGMSAEDSLVQPPGGGNCANWILRHLVNVHNDLATILSHQVYHAGQLATTRPLAGHPGAIRIPGTE